MSVRLARFFGAQDVPESTAQEERRAANRAVICLVLLVVFAAESLTNRTDEFQLSNAALAITFGIGSVIHIALLRRTPDLGPALVYLFAVADPIALTLVLARDPRALPFLNPLLLMIIVAAGMRYGSRTMYLVWSATLVAVLVAFCVEPYASNFLLTLPFALMLSLVPLFFTNLVRQIHRAKTFETERVRLAAMSDVVQARSGFLSRVSHELRSPLQSIVSALDVFELKYGVPQLDTELIGRMRRSSLLLNTQLRDLLTLAKGETGHLEMRPEPFEVIALMEAMADSARPLAEEKGLQLILDIPAEPIFVVADGARIDQVLTNLVANSIRYTDAGQVRASFVGYDITTGNLRFTVDDTGPGLPESTLSTLFAPDKTRVDTARRGEGSGMGLAIVRVLIDRLGGRVDVTSEVGKGTTFRLRIPASPADAELLEKGSGRILVVDDRADVLDAVAGVIEELGFERDRALSAVVATSLLRRRRYDACFVDIDMPEKNGFDLVMEFRQAPGPHRDIRFIAISAVEVSGAERDGFHACLTKPVDRNTLQRTLASVFRPRVPPSASLAAAPSSRNDTRHGS